MTKLKITYRGTVYPWHCDHMGHMNVMWYASKFDEASWQFLSTMGLTASHFREHGVGMVALEQHTQYIRELLAGDTITIQSTVTEINDKTMRLIHEMRNDQTGELAAMTSIVGLHIDVNSRRALSLPTSVRESALGLVSPANASAAFVELDCESGHGLVKKPEPAVCPMNI